MIVRSLLSAAVAFAFSLSALAAEPAAPNYGFLKGNTHVHTDGSGDSDTPVAEAARWYEERGYDFIVVTDHNHVTVHRATGKMLVMPGVEMTFNVYVNDAVEGESGGACIHMNGYFVAPEHKGFIRDGDVNAKTRLAYYESELKSIAKLGGIACLNHPNYTWACDAAVLTRLAAQGLKFFEVFNSADKSMNDGAAGKPSTEKLWDTVLSTGAVIYGIVSDDTHHYYDAAALAKAGGKPRIGNLAWIMVRAEKTDAAIKAGIARGDYYGSTGVVLKKLDASPKAMEIEVAAEQGKTYTIRFIGKEGKVLSEKAAASARYDFQGNEMYVRAMVIDSAGKKAWVQPTFLKK